VSAPVHAVNGQQRPLLTVSGCDVCGARGQPPHSEPTPVPLQGTKVIPSHSRLQPQVLEDFAATTCLGASAAIDCWTKITAQCLGMMQLRAFRADPGRALALAEFSATEAEALQELQEALRSYVTRISSTIKFAFQQLPREWLDAHELGFTVMVNLTLKDTLRDLTMDCLTAYMDYIDSVCPHSVTVASIDDVKVEPSPTAPRGVEVFPPLFALELVQGTIEVEKPVEAPAEEGDEDSGEAEPEPEPEPETELEEDVEEGAGGGSDETPPPEMIEVSILQLSTSTEQIHTALTSLYDQAVAGVQRVPRVDLPYSMEEAFNLRMANGGSMPEFFLDAPQPEWEGVRSRREHIEAATAAALQPLDDFVALFQPYLEFLNADVEKMLADFATADPPLAAIRTEVTSHREQAQSIVKTFPTVAQLGLATVECGAIRALLSSKHERLALGMLDVVLAKAVTLTGTVCSRMDDMLERVLKPPHTIEELKEQVKYLEGIPDEVAVCQVDIDTVREMTDELEVCEYEVEDSVFSDMYTAILWPGKLNQAVESISSGLGALRDKMEAEMEGAMLVFAKDLKAVAEQVNAFSKHDDLKKVESVAAEARKIQATLDDLGEKSRQFVSRSLLFDKEPEDYEELADTAKQFLPYVELWVTADEWLKNEEKWLKGPFADIDADVCEEFTQTSFKTMFKYARRFTNEGVTGCAKVATTIRDQIGEFKPFVPVVKALRNPGMRDRHWHSLAEKVAIAKGKPYEKIDVENLTLHHATSVMKLHDEQLMASVLAVAEVSGKEFAIEKMLDKMYGLWEPIEYIVDDYKATGTFIIKGTDEIVTLLDDHIVATQAMSFSPYKAAFEERIIKWEALLRNVQDITTAWLAAQKNWMYLQPIFSSEDIARQLPNETKMFKNADRVYRKVLQDAKKRPSCLRICKDPKLLKVFEDMDADLEDVQKNLADYLETKRNAFARFFFMSNDELIEILSQTKDPPNVQPHLKKCFESVNKLEFQEDNSITGMWGKEGEFVKFHGPVHPEGGVEDWLTDVKKMMQITLYYEMEKALKDYEGGEGRKRWVLAWPGMCVLQASQTYWTTDLGKLLEEKGLDGPKEFIETAERQLKDLTILVRTKLTKLQRRTLGAVLVMEVHARDVVNNFIRDKVGSTEDFDWISQLRYYWITEDMDTSVGPPMSHLPAGPGIIAKMCQCVYPYGYEYLGNSMRLVITPLTDRCYMTLMGAMHILLGGAPAGPAGTGKTETTKDLAKALAKYCVVFNCSDGLDYIQMGKFFKGLAVEGAWACYDEFNRIDVEVLSVVAQQVSAVQQAVKRKQTQMFFEGSNIILDWTCNSFITMNPGYAGRTELPDNLKVLYRPMSMMVPSYALIAEIRNYSFGFDNSRACSEKLVCTFRLSAECLSAQSHYDYGMRAVNTVIQACGLLKSLYPDMDEFELLLRAVRDSNKPKFLKEDIVLFTGILSDVFSGTTEPIAEYPEFDKALAKHALLNNIQPVEKLTLKCTQMYEMSTVRHGFMLVGPTGGGKSAVCRVLQAALTESHGGQQEFDRTRIYPINPKSLMSEQLYGATDLSTGEWADGIVAVLMRHCANPDEAETGVKDDDIKWVYFDGPVDAIWIENMNTVLDDNKKLCLNSGEIIQLSETMRVIFESHDLQHASPATVSRCGMIWIEPSHLVPIEGERASECPLNKSFLDQLPDHIMPYKEKLAVLIDKYLDGTFEVGLLDHVRRLVKETVLTVDNNLLKSFYNLQAVYYESFVPQHEDDVISEEVVAKLESNIEPWFIFSLIWSLGASADSTGRPVFEKKIREMMEQFECTCAPPVEDGKTVYDYFYSTDEQKWVYWLKTIPEYSVPRGAQFADILVPSVDTIRSAYLLKELSLKQRHTLFVGETGTSKTAVVKDVLLNQMPDNYTPIMMGFSAQTTANMSQDILDGKFDKRRQGRDKNDHNKPAFITPNGFVGCPSNHKAGYGMGYNSLDTGLPFTMWGPPIGGQFVVFIDDFNMPACETYDAQPSIEIIRTLLDYKGWFDRKTWQWKQMVDLCVCGAMGPPGGGRNPVSERTTRHFNYISLVEMSDASIALVFNTILSNFLKSFADDIQNISESVVNGTINIINQVRVDLLPTPEKAHYTFNLRDIASVVQGCMSCSNKKVSTSKGFVRLWVHESRRVFSDRFVSYDDVSYFEGLLETQCDEQFGMKLKETVPEERLMMVDFLVPGTDFESRIYEEAPPIDELQKLVEEYLDDYNSQYVPMPLVLFGDAIEHVARISRVIRAPLGNSLLLGVGGSGRKSLARLASFIADFTTFTIEITKSYRLLEWREDLKMLLLKAGLDGKKMVFLFDDAQIVDETFVEDINNILNAGDVPNLMKDEDLGPIFDKMTPILVSRQIPSTKVNLYNMFISRVKENLHLVLAFSPIGDAFRNRLRNFPSLVNCCTLDWFHPWPVEALVQVANKQLAIDGLEESTYLSVVEMCGFVHKSVEKTSVRYWDEMVRKNYVTPTSYLELLKAINSLIVSKRGEMQQGIQRLQVGLDKLSSTNEQVGTLKQMIIEKQPVLEKTLADVAAQQIVIDQEKTTAASIKENAEKASAGAAVKAAEVKVIADDAQADLDKALPALDAATKCLKELQKNDIVEVKSNKNPTPPVKLTLQGVCIMFGVKPIKENNPDGAGKIDNWYKACQPLLANPQAFLDSLMNFDKDNIPEKVIKTVQSLVDNPDFTPEKIKKASNACTAICTWVLAMHTYYFIARDVEPKRQKLAAAQAELDEVNAMLAKAQGELDAVNAKLAQLDKDFQIAIQTKKELEEEMENCEGKLERADKLLGGLGGEAVRWKATVEDLKKAEVNVIGDVLVAAGTISYLGPFTQRYRSETEKEWHEQLTKLKLPHTPGCTMMSTLIEPVVVRGWNLQGLPSDDFSVANGIIMTNSSRWPLMMDPQGQANRWIRNMEESSGMVALKASASPTSIQRSLENCIQFGRPLMIENVGETMDPMLEPVLSNATFKTSTGELVIKLGDQTIPFHEDFRFYMTTILPNPHYAPEVAVKVALLLFAITPGGLEEQLLNATVEEERADLAELKARLVVENADNMRKIKELEDKILYLLANSKGDILDDVVLIDTLAVSKTTSNEIAAAVEAAEKTGKEIDATRELYRPVAYRASVLFFCIADLCIVDPMYQYSLEWFVLLFRNGFVIAEKSDDLQQRLKLCMDAFMLSLYQNVCRSLFEKDKLMFSFNLCVRVRTGYKMIDPVEWRYLLTGASKKLDTPMPEGAQWLTDGAWNEIQNMDESVPVFEGFMADFVKHIDHYRGYFDSNDPEKMAQMPGWDEKLNSLQKMIILRAIRPDKVMNAVQMYIIEHLNQRFIEPPPFDLEPCFNDSVPTSPLVFVLVSGADPTGALIAFAEDKGMLNGKYHAISLGQGQGPKAEVLINSGMEAGHWILLQNCHLATSWMSSLEAIVEGMDPEKVNPSFRLWLTSMPSKAFPVSILQNGVKMTNEPPKGLRSNMMAAYYVYNDEFMDQTDKPENWCARRLYCVCSLPRLS
jgi:dynein heavy chain